MSTVSQTLSGQVAVVTGGSGGIGTAIIQALCDAGAKAISLDLAAPQEKEIPWIRCDVRDDQSVATAIAQVNQENQRIDIAVHGAGVSREAVIWKLAVDDWDFMQAVNLRGAFLLLRHVIPIMRQAENPAGGRIVLIGSINGSRGKFGTAAYSASKAGLLGLAKSVAREVGRFGILVNVVEPGWVRTPLTESLPQSIRDAAVAESALGKLLDPADIGAATLFLCGPGAKRITGQILRVDAGQHIG